MREPLITFETAKLANEKGFEMTKFDRAYSLENPMNDKEKLHQASDIPNYSDRIFAPSQSLLQKWLRDKYKINLNVFYSKWQLGDNPLQDGYVSVYPKAMMVNDDGEYITMNFPTNKTEYYETYEEALEVGLIYALNLIK